MPKKTREPFAAGGLDDPAKQFREFAAECLELGRDIASPEKRRMYLEARVWYQMTRRWEKDCRRVGQADGISLLNEYFV